MSINRIILIILDSVGVGELPDAHLYDDQGANTLQNIAEAVGGLFLPNLEKMGLGNIIPVLGIAKVGFPLASYGKMAAKSPGKDTITGHWELAGQVLLEPFATYPQFFPKEIIDKIEKSIGTGTLGNIAASGTEIIEALGNEHIATGKPIIYTSADSVLQLAAHEEIISPEHLNEYCLAIRNILQPPAYNIARIISRPFSGSQGKFIRTSDRHDFSLQPPYPTILDLIKEKGLDVVGIGKINDIFAGRGITDYQTSSDNQDGILKTIAWLTKVNRGLIFTNLVDFDMKYGHRNDCVGYANALKEFDEHLPEILEKLKADDILIITADHGCDPTQLGTNHTREYVPLLIYGDKLNNGSSLGIRDTFADVAMTIACILKTAKPPNGTDMSSILIKK